MALSNRNLLKCIANGSDDSDAADDDVYGNADNGVLIFNYDYISESYVRNGIY